MADSACYIELASNNGDFFTNSLTDDIMIRPQYATQKILIGTSNGQVPSLSITSNNVGIGTTTPAYKLDVVGDINFTGAFRQNGTPYVGSQWSNDSTNVFLLGSNVGIGVSNPSTKLDILGDVEIVNPNNALHFTISNNNSPYMQIHGSNGVAVLGVASGATSHSSDAAAGDSILKTLGAATGRLLLQTQSGASAICINSNNRVGVGMTTPTAPLHVKSVSGTFPNNNAIFVSNTGTTTSDNASIGIQVSGNSGGNPFYSLDVSAVNGWSIGISNADNEKLVIKNDWNFATNPRLTIDTSGNVGIGTTTPGYPLDVVGDINFTGTFRKSGVPYVGSQWSNNSSNVFLLGSNVGIGISNAAYTLDVQGNVGITNAGNKKLQFVNDATTNRHIVLYETANNEHQYYGFGVNSSTLRYQVSGTGASHVFYTGTTTPSSTELMRIQGTGRVGIGTASPSYPLHVYSNIAGALQLGLENPNTGTAGYCSFTARSTNETRMGMLSTGWTATGPFLSDGGFVDCTGTAGLSIAARNATGTLRFYSGGDTERMRLDSSGNLGIGTTSPSQKLDVSGVIRSTGTISSTDGTNFTQLYQDGALMTKTGTYLRFGTVDSIGGATNWSEKMRIHTDGNVGIGTSSPSYKLDVSGVVRVANGILMNQNDDTYIGINAANSAPSLGIVKKSFSYAHFAFTSNNGDSTTANAMYFGMLSGSNLAAVSACNLTTYMTLNNAGNLGIGTMTPGYKVDVVGDIHASNNCSLMSGTTEGFLRMVGVGNANYIQSGLTNTTNSAAPLIFSTINNGTEWARFNNNGNFGIGTTSPAYKLDVNAYANIDKTYFFNDSVPFGNSSTNRRYALLGTFGANQGFGIIEGIVGGHSGGGTQGKATFRITINSRDVVINGNVANLTGNTANGIVIYKSTTTSDFTAYLTSQDFCRYNVKLHVGDGVTVSTSLSWSADTAWTTPAGTALWFDSITHIPGSGLGTDFRMTTAATPVYGLTTLNGGNVGIGNSNPSFKLDVSGDTRVGSLLRLGSNTVGSAIELTDIANASWRIDTGGYLLNFLNDNGGSFASKMVIDNTGEVGIGTTNPLYKLDVNGTSRIKGTWTNGGSNLLVLENQAGSRIQFVDEFGSVPCGMASFNTGNGLGIFATTQIGFYTSNVSSSNSVQRMIITQAGNVGIGTTTPAYPLDVNGDVTLRGRTIIGNSNYSLNATGIFNVYNPGSLDTGGARLWITASNNTHMTIGKHASIANGEGYIWLTGAHSLAIGTNNTERMKIDSSGNVGIGTTSPSSTLHVVGNTILNGGNQIVVQNSQNGGAGRGIYMWALTDTNWAIYMSESGAGRSISGGAACTGVNFSSWAVRFRVNTGNTAGFIFENSGEVCLASIRNDGLTFFNNTATAYNASIGNAGHGAAWAAFAHSNSFNTTSYALLSQDAGDTYLNSASGRPIRFREGNVDKAMLSNGNFGIGTTTPSYPLDIINATAANAVIRVGSSTFGSGRIMLGNSSHGIARGASISGANDGNDVTVHTAGFGSVTLATAGGEGLRVNASANVGIGTTSPSYKLDVTGNCRVFGRILVTDSSSTNGSRPSQGVYVWDDTGFGMELQNQYGSWNTTFITRSTDGGFTWKKSDGTFQMIMTSNNNLGIGTTTPAYPLDVNGNAKVVASSTTTGLLVQRSDVHTIIGNTAGGTNYGSIQVRSGGTSSAVGSSAYALYLQPDGGSIFTGSGNVGIGTTTPAYKLDITGDARTSGEVISTSANSFRIVNGNYGIFHRNDGADYYFMMTGSGFPYGSYNSFRPFRLNFATGSVYIGDTSLFVANNGNVGVGTSSPSYKLHVVGDIYATGDIIGFSDKRLKSNITIIDDALSKIHKINGYTYNLPNDEKTHTGLIAQEVKEVLPEAVYQERKEDGTEGHYSLAYGNMAGLLVEAIKEIDNKYKSQITDLQQQIAILKNEIDILKNKSS